MKTPEQIARELYDPESSWALGSGEVIPLLVAAIEAYREQIYDRLPICAWCPSIAFGRALHIDGMSYPSCGEVLHGMHYTEGE